MIKLAIVKEKGRPRHVVPTKNHYRVSHTDYQMCERLEEILGLPSLPVGSVVELMIAGVQVYPAEVLHADDEKAESSSTGS